MNDEILKSLNSIYQPLCKRYEKIASELKTCGFEIVVGFYNNHSVKSGGEFVTEYYPIPVLTVSQNIDLGFDIDSVWLEIRLPKDNAAKLDYIALSKKYKIEVYGCDAYLSDFYNCECDPELTAQKIIESNETQICIAFDFAIDISGNEIIKVIKQIESK